MKITFLGTCAGTEPIPGRHHTSLIVSVGDESFFVDAGEGCGYRAHLMGYDMLALRRIFITHAHMDHVGGLANLLWYQRKLWLMRGSPVLGGQPIRVYIPDLESWEGIWRMLQRTEGHFRIDYRLEPVRYDDGVIEQRPAYRVIAHHNHHIREIEQDTSWPSYSFRVEADGLTTVISGDVGDMGDLEPLLDGADWLLMETGHHQVETIALYLRDHFPKVRLCLYHHGRAMLADPVGEAARAETILNAPVAVAEEGGTLVLDKADSKI